MIPVLEGDMSAFGSASSLVPNKAAFKGAKQLLLPLISSIDTMQKRVYVLFHFGLLFRRLESLL